MWNGSTRAKKREEELELVRRHNLDLRITEAILRRGDFAYLGLRP